jgi:hypothetical protein
MGAGFPASLAVLTSFNLLCCAGLLIFLAGYRARLDIEDLASSSCGALPVACPYRLTGAPIARPVLFAGAFGMLRGGPH